MNFFEKKHSSISRRKFLDLSIQGAAGLTLAAPLLGAQACTSAEAKTVHGACYHDCPDTCSWTVTAVDGKVTGFKASRSNPYTAGKLCGKMNDFPNDVTFHPGRMLTPLKRVGPKGAGEFEAIPWEQAIGEVRTTARVREKVRPGIVCMPQGHWPSLMKGGSSANALTTDRLTDMGAGRPCRKQGWKWDEFSAPGTKFITVNSVSFGAIRRCPFLT